MEFGFSQVAQLVRRQSFAELREIDRGVALFQVLVEQVAIRAFLEQLDGFAEELTVAGLLRDRVGQKAQQGPSLADADQRRLAPKTPIVQPQHGPDHAAHMPARIAVVADVADAVRDQVPAADVEDLFLHFGRNPRIDAVANNVIEAVEAIVDIENAHLPQPNVFQT